MASHLAVLHAQIIRFFFLRFSNQNTLVSVCKIDDNDVCASEWACTEKGTFLVLAMGNSRVPVFYLSPLFLSHPHTNAIRRKHTYFHDCVYACEYCQNGCWNEIWNGSLKAVARISKHHLVYEYHDGYIYRNSISRSLVLLFFPFWRIHRPATMQPRNYSNAQIQSMNRTKNRRHVRQARSEEKFQPSVSMEMFYLFSIILFYLYTHTATSSSL